MSLAPNSENSNSELSSSVKSTANGMWVFRSSILFWLNEKPLNVLSAKPMNEKAIPYDLFDNPQWNIIFKEGKNCYLFQ